MTYPLAFAILTFLLAIVVACLRLFRDLRKLQKRYSHIIDLDAAASAARANLEQEKCQQQEYESDYQQRRAQLEKEYKEAATKYNNLKEELSSLEENLEDISFGLYKPHFDFDTPEDYKIELEKVRDRQRQMIRSRQAATCPIQWTVGGSAKEGKRLVRLYEKALLRAFNGESDAAVANVSWSNVVKMEERVRRSFESLNKLGEVTKVFIAPTYLEMKIDELRLTHDYEAKKYKDREEQRRIREQIREEERAKQEIEKARKEAEDDEARFQKALELAREEAAKATGAQLEKLTQQVNSFEAKLDEARKKKERAISRAQLTESGFVYVISNIGSFGENVVKIGMTRRMEPMDRIHELGDASVPFPFDLHVMLYSDNAPELENSLHELVAGRELNLVNQRKEFYRNVDLEEIENFVKKRGLSAQFVKYPEARQFRESLARRAQQQTSRPSEQPRVSEQLFQNQGSISAK